MNKLDTNTTNNTKSAFLQGIRDGVPIALGYLAVSFSLGIAAKKAGLSVFQGFLASLLNNASAGEYAGFLIIAASAPYWECALITLITNARYMLMSCALSQRFSTDTSFIHRIGVGFFITDELFGIAVARKGDIDPLYTYGAASVAVPAWAIGTALGIFAGNILPLRIVSALGVALYGMFLAIIIPPTKKDKAVAGAVIVSFLLSFILSEIKIFAFMKDGTKTILLTVVISAIAAAFFPKAQTSSKEEEND